VPKKQIHVVTGRCSLSQL